jgi:hypothetical protein
VQRWPSRLVQVFDRQSFEVFGLVGRQFIQHIFASVNFKIPRILWFYRCYLQQVPIDPRWELEASLLGWMSCDRGFFGLATALKSGAIKMNLCWQLSGKPSLPIDLFARRRLAS